MEVVAPLRLVSCHGPALTDLHDHPDAADGLRYRSRHDDDEMCIALFTRAAAKLHVTVTRPLLDPATRVIDAINHYEVAVRGS